jgi:hypothetical protein
MTLRTSREGKVDIKTVTRGPVPKYIPLPQISRKLKIPPDISGPWLGDHFSIFHTGEHVKEKEKKRAYPSFPVSAM